MHDLNTFHNAFNGVSFNPQKYFENFIKDYKEIILELTSYCQEKQYNKTWMENKINEAAADYLSKTSRTASSFVVGPANFPVERNRKRMESAHKALEKYIYYANNFKSLLDKYNKEPETEQDKKRKWADKVTYLKTMHEEAKKFNRIRAKAGDNEEAAKNADLLAIMENFNEIKEAVTTEYELYGIFGLPHYFLPYNLANIKRLEGQLKAIDKAVKRGEIKKDFNNCKLEHNDDELRWNIFFEGKPSDEIRTVLKRNGFKWSPKRGAWTRGSKTMPYNRLESIINNF